METQAKPTVTIGKKAEITSAWVHFGRFGNYLIAKVLVEVGKLKYRYGEITICDVPMITDAKGFLKETFGDRRYGFNPDKETPEKFLNRFYRGCKFEIEFEEEPEEPERSADEPCDF